MINWWYFFLVFTEQKEFDIPLVTICMRRQILFSAKSKKNISKCRLLKKFTQMTNLWYFSQTTGFPISCKLSSICMNCQIWFSKKNKKKNIFQNVVCWKFYPECLVLNKYLWQMIDGWSIFLLKVVDVYLCLFLKQAFVFILTGHWWQRSEKKVLK